MEWKQEAMEKLRRYNTMRVASENLSAEIEMLRDASTDLQSGANYGPKVRGGGYNREEELINNLVMRQELEWTLKQVRQWLAITDRGLAVLTPEERLVLQRLYLLPEKGAVDTLCTELRVEQATVYRKRDRAIRRFTMALYGISEM